MEAENPRSTWDLIQEKSEQFFRLYTSIASQIDTNIPLKEIEDFCQKVRRGPCLNLAICGPTNSGKSTALNYLLGSGRDGRSLLSFPFLTADRAETSAPWFFREDRQLELDEIEVSHVKADDTESPKVRFTDVRQYRDYLRRTYSRKVIEEEKEREQSSVHPYQKINISYGMPFGSESSVLSNALFETGLNLFDLQGLSEPGENFHLQDLPSPFVIICCFDFTKNFFAVDEYARLKERIDKGKHAHIIFICTQVEASLRGLHRVQEDKKQEKIPFDQESLFQTMQDQILGYLNKDFEKKDFSLFFFEPKGRYEQFRGTIKDVRDRLIELRNGLNLYQKFNEETSKELSKYVIRTKNALIIHALSMTNPTAVAGIQEHRAKFKEVFTKLSLELINRLKTSIPEELPGRIAELAKHREASFMEDKPTPILLQKKLNEWLLNGGLSLALMQIVANEMKQFLSFKKTEVHEILAEVSSKSFVSEENGKLIEDSQGSFTTLFQTTFAALTARASFTPIVLLKSVQIGAIVIGVGVMVGALWVALRKAASYFGVANFGSVLEEWSESIRPSLKNHEMLMDFCCKISKRFIDNWKGNLIPEMEEFYVKSFVKDLSPLNEYLKTNMQVDIEEFESLISTLKQV